MRVPRVVRFGRGDLNRTPLLKVVGPDGSDPSPSRSRSTARAKEVAFTVLATADWTADIAPRRRGLRPLRPQRRDGQHQVTVVAARNLSGATRSATVSFRLGGEALRLRSPQTEATYLDVDPRRLDRRRPCGVHRRRLDQPKPVEGRDRQPDGTTAETTPTVKEERLDHLPGRRERRAGTAQRRSNSSRASPQKSSTTSPSRRGYVVPAPTADLLDVVFAEDGTAKDVSAMGMTVELLPDPTLSTVFLEKYDRYALYASRANRAVLRPCWKADSTRWSTTAQRLTFRNKLEGWRAMECSCEFTTIPKNCRSNLSLRAEGGVSICFWADGSNQIVMGRAEECHRRQRCGKPPGSVTPLKDLYHIVAVARTRPPPARRKSLCRRQVEGAPTIPAGGEFRHRTPTSTNAGSESAPTPIPTTKRADIIQRRGWSSRIYDDPINADQVHALWKLVK